MKFINYLSSIAGVDVFPLISLLIFFTFFTGLIWYVLRYDRKEEEIQRSMPFDNAELQAQSVQNSEEE